MPDCSAANTPSCPQTILDLIERFDLHRETYQRETYNETQVRREFIDPFFKSLGWDVDNKLGHAEAYKDVIHEDAIKVGGSTKAPDYCFRIGGVRKFFVEAKKPSVSVGDDPGPAYQLRRYAWTNKLPLSIVTDFEELAVYDCRIKPKPDDKPSTARVLYLKCDEYPKRWDEIASIFSKDSILKGSFDKYAESNKRKRGTAEVDDEFLKEIESWRDELARNIALRNPNLSVRDLNYAVGKTIDRIIFLRMCEDRGVETYAQLRLLLNGPRVYPRLVEIFYRADERYNSGLFHFEPEKNRHDPPDNLTPNLTIDDAVLKDILKNLYYPQCPYEFSVMPPEILGQVYEQFLGKVITLTAGHRAKVEYKPEVKKAGGVYYTPKYIVDYIVEHTVGKLLAECKTPTDAAKLRILDPACGSGSFLLGAYQALLDWHLKWYSDHEAEKWARKKAPPIYQVGATKDGPLHNCRGSDRGAYRLTITEKKRILLSNIYGVDIDPQAVEVTKLSLLLKVLEGESQQTLDNQLRLFHERALPDLGGNIKCGNSLIGPDFYDNQQLELLDEEERYRVNVFDWEAEFSDIMRNGGFDAVIGNPPYIDSEWMSRYLPETRTYCVPRYAAASGNWDIFCVFIERALRLCRQNGVVSFIVPNKLISANYARGVRTVMTNENTLVSIRDFSRVPVFPVAVYPIVFVVRKGRLRAPGKVLYEKMEVLESRQVACASSRELDQRASFSDPTHPWELSSSPNGESWAGRIRGQFPSLESFAQVHGAATVSEAYEMVDILVDADAPRTDRRDLLVVNSGTIDRYDSLWGRKPLRYLGKSLSFPIIPVRSISKLPKTRRQQSATPKIVVAGMTKVLECILDAEGRILAAKSTTIVLSELDLRYLLGLLNSQLISAYYDTTYGGDKLSGGYLRVGPPQIRTLPIALGNTDDKVFRKRHECIVELVQRMLDLHKQFAAAKTPSDQTAIQRQIDATDRQIDQLVYELYGLSDEEIQIVEEATQQT